MAIRRILGLLSVSLIMAILVAGCADLVEDEEDSDASGDQDERTVDVASSDESEDAESEAGDGDDAAGSDNDATVDIGAVLSLSGQNATYGDPQSRGIELALADLEGAEGVSFSASFLDDEGDPETGAERFNKHIEGGVDAIIGPTLSNTAFEAHPVAQENGIPVLAISNTAEGVTDIGDYIFRVSLAEASVVPQTVNVIAQGWQPETAALVYSEDDAWSRSSADAFRAAADSHGIEIVTEQDIPSAGGDLSDQVDSIAGADPDVIFLSALEQASIEFVSQAREHGLQQDIACGNGCNSGTFVDATGDASEGIIVGSAWHPELGNDESEAFVERYREMYDADPDQFSAQAYAGVQILAEAATQSDDLEPASLRNALAGLGEVETVLGPFSFDDNRDGSHPAVIKVVADGEFTLFGK